MEDSYVLTVDFLHYWRNGTGKGSGSHVDATVDVDEYGCPFVGGSMLKGQLRDAVSKSAHWRQEELSGQNNAIEANAIVNVLFGTPGFIEESVEDSTEPAVTQKRARSDTKPGIIRVGSATLPRDVRQWLSRSNPHRNALFRDLYATAIDSSSGTAKKGSLRGQQVVVPVKLSAELSVAKFSDDDSDEQNENAWVYNNHKSLIEKALPLIRTIGSGRTRGLGRVKLSLEAV